LWCGDLLVPTLQQVRAVGQGALSSNFFYQQLGETRVLDAALIVSRDSWRSEALLVKDSSSFFDLRIECIPLPGDSPFARVRWE